MKIEKFGENRNSKRGDVLVGLRQSKPAVFSEITKRSVWRGRSKQTWSFYCPCCELPRKLPYQPRPSVAHALQIGLTSLMFTLLTWNWFDWKGIVSFLPLWLGFEMIYRARTRAALACETCGFDPFLYLNDLPRAREVVEAHWRKKFAEKGIPYPEKNAPVASTAPSAQASASLSH